MVLKISLGIFFMRLTVSRAQQIVIYVTVTTSLIFSIAMFLFAVFQCGYYRNVGVFITKRLTNECASNATALGMTYTHGSIAALTDWTFLLLPIFILRGALMTLRQKLTIGLLLAFAALSGIAAIVRFPYIKELAVPKQGFFGMNVLAGGFWRWT
jgi:hypothetical protein